MQTELIYTASKLFPTLEHWQSFVELSNEREAIAKFWFVEATNRIRRHFMETLGPEWVCEPFHDTRSDTRWFLEEFGPESLGICYFEHYTLLLRRHNDEKFDNHKISTLLKKCEYRAVQLAFDRIDQRFPAWNAQLLESGNFKFGTAHDGNIPPLELAWHAAHQMDAFVDQAVLKIERFTKSPNVTELLRQLNQSAQDRNQAISA